MRRETSFKVMFYILINEGELRKSIKQILMKKY